MSKDSSFDIVSEVDLQEVDNAVNQAAKEIETRYDFKGSQSEIRFDRTKKEIKMITRTDIQLKSIIELLHQKLSKRGVPIKALKLKEPEKTFDGKMSKMGEIIQGIEHEQAKELVKGIKELKLKVQASIQEDRIRVSGKSKNDLQVVISTVHSMKISIPLQFINYR